MRAIIQRVANASVKINNKLTVNINKGLLVLLGIEQNDDANDIEWLSGKISRLRIFDDEQGVMNLSVNEVEGDILVISQFTLHASTKKGNRPSYIKAAKPESAKLLYEYFIEHLQKNISKNIQTGEFGANMNVNLTNEGPVTILIDSKNKE